MEDNKPRAEEQTDRKIGILRKIEGYVFTHIGESIPGSTCDKSEVITTLLIGDDRGLEHKVEFNGFIGGELVGREVLYEEKTTIKTELFDGKGRENDPTYRAGIRKINKICKLTPADGKAPSYTSISHYQHSLF